MILHIVSKSPYTSSAFADAVKLFAPQDAVIFIDDGVYACTVNTLYAQQLSALSNQGISCYALNDDLAIRGLIAVDSCIQTLAMPEFVALVFQADKTVSWY